MMRPLPMPQPIASPFDLLDPAAYLAWRQTKLERYPREAAELVVEISNPLRLTWAETAAIDARVRASNMAIAVTASALPKETFTQFCAQLGLMRLDKNLLADDDGISELHVVPEGRAHEYIPYSNKPINWHTDGYYNPLDRLIRAMVLHCVQPAAYGGENALLDHEIIYLLLRDLNPEHIVALMHPQCMTIPPNVENGVEIRAAQSGPVFSVDTNGRLHMRYTARTRSIVWRDDAATHAAVAALEALLNAPSTPIFQHRMESGHSIVCNNVLHTRTEFEDDATTGEQRRVYRARYYDRIRMNL